jgi:transcription termination factor Rho
VVRIDAVNGLKPEEIMDRSDFAKMRAVHPDDQLVLDCGLTRGGKPDYTNRIIDLFCPFGKGQRSLIVAPAKAGKTMVLQAIAEGVVSNNPQCTLLILLIDERPEEVTEMEVCGFGEVVASSFDQSAERHVELGSGRTLSGGLDATSLEKPKRFLGSARKIDSGQGGGSLTIVGTALIDTGSRMDQVIFEEFKGTGNSELVLSRELAERRIFPAIDLDASATRREELLLSDEFLATSNALRRQLGGMSTMDQMKAVLTYMKDTESNAELVGL